MRNKISFLSIIVAVMVIVLSISFHPLSNEKLAENQVLQIGGEESDLRTADPHLGVDVPGRTIPAMVFNALVRYKPGDIKQFEPDLAKSIPEPVVLENGSQKWVFNLKEGIRVHPFNGNANGYELTSEDVVYSFRKASNSARSAYASAYKGMDFKAVDKYKVEITLKNPMSRNLFLPNIANYGGGFIVPKKPIEAMGGEAFKTNPVGTGPFMVKNHSPSDKTTLVANPDYFRGKPILEKVVYNYMPSLSSREMAMRKGAIQLTYGLREEKWLAKMDKIEGVEIITLGPGNMFIVHLNTTQSHFNNLKVRQAIGYALNRPTLVEYTGETISKPLYSVINPSYLKGGLTKEEIAAKNLAYHHNLEKAKELMAEAGYSSGFTIQVFSSEIPDYLNYYQLIKAQLDKIGINMEIKVVDHATYHTNIREDLSPLVLYICWRPTADAWLTRFFHSDSIVVEGDSPDTNFSHYSKIDELIENARQSLSASKQIELWKEANYRILEDAVAIPLIEKSFAYVGRENVDWGHPTLSTLNYNPGITENTRILSD